MDDEKSKKITKKKTYKLDREQLKTIIDQSRTDDEICPTAKDLVDSIDEEYDNESGKDSQEQDEETEVYKKEKIKMPKLPKMPNFKLMAKLKWFFG